MTAAVITAFKYARNARALLGLYFATVLLVLYAAGQFAGACR